MTDQIDDQANTLLHLMDRLRDMKPGKAPPQEAKISPSQLSLINFTASNPGCGIQAIATGLKLAKPTVSIGVSQLESAGFFSRQPDPEDGRAVQLFLTPKGMKLHQRTLEYRCKKFTNLLSELDPEERITLITLLEKAVNAAENNNKGKTK